MDACLGDAGLQQWCHWQVPARQEADGGGVGSQWMTQSNLGGGGG